MSVRRFVLLLVLLSPAVGSAQVTYPTRPEQSDVTLRYRIRADRDERIRQFRAMTAFLDQLKFVPEDREDADLDIFDPTAEILRGTIPTENATKLLGDPRIVTVLYAPGDRGLTPPAGRAEVRLRIAGPLADVTQRQLHEQVVRHLGLLGFTEAISYDTAGYRLVRGSLPADNLDRLVRDLRGQPTGWFLATVPPAYLPSPLRTLVPVRLVEVLPEPAVPTPAFQPPGLAPDKLTDDLRAIVSDPARQADPIRVDVILATPPAAGGRELRFRLQSQVSGASLEGIVGVVATVRLQSVADVNRLALIPEVTAMRLPRDGHGTIADIAADSDSVKVDALLASSRVGELLQLGYRGDGVRVVVIGAGFPGVDGLVGSDLPAGTRVVDLTAELNPTLLPIPGPEDVTATGTLVARSVHAVAPAADLTLVRVDPTAFHQLLTVARAVGGSRDYSVAMLSRSVELIDMADELEFRRTRVVDEYTQAFNNLGDGEKASSRRAAAASAMKTLLADEAAHRGRLTRLAGLKAAVDALAGANVVVNTLVWESGYPLDGLSEVSQYLNASFSNRAAHAPLGMPERPTIPVWVQAGSDALGRVWAGPFRDTDGNGILEFAPESSPRPQGRWTRELNFLRYVPTDGMSGGVIPAGAKLRFTVQWREPHPAGQLLPAEPVFPLTLRLLRQVDPLAQDVASDELFEVARSTTPPVRLMKTDGSGVYERTVDVTIPADGVYALRIDGGAATSPLVPALETGFELYPRVVIDAADAPTASAGRVGFDTFTPRAVGVGIPGDSSAALTVGVGRPPAYTEAESLTGAGPGVALAAKPDLLTAGTIVVDASGGTGPGVSTGFAGGVAAVLASTGTRASDLIRTAGMTPGGPLELPRAWLDQLRPRTAKIGSER